MLSMMINQTVGESSLQGEYSLLRSFIDVKAFTIVPKFLLAFETTESQRIALGLLRVNRKFIQFSRNYPRCVTN